MQETPVSCRRVSALQCDRTLVPNRCARIETQHMEVDK